MGRFPMTQVAQQEIGAGKVTRVDAQLSESGRIDGNMHMENDVLIFDPSSGYCATALIGLMDAAGNMLEYHRVPDSCLDGKWPGGANKMDIPFEFRVQSSEALTNVQQLKIRVLEVKGRWLPALDDIIRLINGI